MSENVKAINPAVLTIDDGSRRYPIYNQFGDEVGEFYLSPSDIGVFERFAAMRDEVDAIAAPFEGLADDMTMDAFVAATAEAKERMFAAIDKMFAMPGSAARLFGSRHPFMPVGGRFYFDRVFELIGAQINATMADEAAKFAAPAVAKYTAKKAAKK